MTKGFKKSWRLVLITMIVIILFSLFGSLPIFGRRRYIVSIMAEMSIFFPVIVGLHHIQKKKDVRDIFSNGFSPVIIPLLVILPFCLQTFITYVTLPYHGILSELVGEYESHVYPANSLKSFIVQLVSVCIVPAVAEEFLFRGVMMRFLKPYGVGTALVVSSLAFAMMHFDLYTFLIIFMLGMLLGAVRIMTGSVWASVLMHFSNNLGSILLLMIPKNMETQVSMILNPVSFIVFPLAFCLLLKNTSEIQPERIRRKTEFSYEMIICIGVFCLISVLSI